MYCWLINNPPPGSLRVPGNARAIPSALWAAPGGAAWHNQLWRVINNKLFQCSNGRDSPQRRRSAARVEQGDLFKFYARSRSLISAHLWDAPVTSWRASWRDSFHDTSRSPSFSSPARRLLIVTSLLICRLFSHHPPCRGNTDLHMVG